MIRYTLSRAHAKERSKQTCAPANVKSEGVNSKPKKEKSLSPADSGTSQKKPRKKPSSQRSSHSAIDSESDTAHDSITEPPRKRAKVQKNLVDNELLQSLQHFTSLQQAHKGINSTPLTTKPEDSENVKTSPRARSRSTTPVTPRSRKASASPKTYSNVKFRTYLSSDSSDVSSLSEDEDERLSDWSSDPEINAMLAPLLKKDNKRSRKQRRNFYQ